MMENSPFFTVIIPVYSVENYIGRCLDSVLGQCFADFEIICIDDGSPDNSIDILNSYAAKDSRIKIIRKENGGLPSARNSGLYDAKGRYVFFLDSDDTMCEDALQNAYTAICEENCPDLLNTGFIKNLYGEILTYDCVYPGDEFFDESLTGDERWIKLWHSRKTVDLIMTKFIRRDFLRDSGIVFNTRLFAQEDSDFAFNIYRKAKTMAYRNFYSFCYFKYRAGSLSTEWSYKAITSVFSRWYNFFYNDVQFYKLNDECRKIVEAEKQEFLIAIRRGIFKLGVKYTDDEVNKIVTMLERCFEKDIKKLPMTKGPFGFVYPLYRIIGIRKTVKLLRLFVHIRDSIIKK